MPRWPTWPARRRGVAREQHLAGRHERHAAPEGRWATTRPCRRRGWGAPAPRARSRRGRRSRRGPGSGACPGWRAQASTACRPSAGMPRPAWTSTGRPPLVGEREHAVERRVVEREALGARVELDSRARPRPGSARPRRAGRPPGRAGRRAPARRPTPPPRRAPCRWRPSSRPARASGRRPPRAPARLEQLDQLRARAVVAVGVVGAEVGVGVEQLDPGHLVASTVEEGEELGVGRHGSAAYPSLPPGPNDEGGLRAA